MEDGVGRVLLEIHRRGDEYVLFEVDPPTGNRLLRFSLEDSELVYGALDRALAPAPLW